MSFLKSPQYASVTTRLLTIIDDRMPRRHQIILAVLVVFLTLASIAGSRPAERPTTVQPAIILIATPTPQTTGAIGLVKEAGRMDLGNNVPEVAPQAPTAAPIGATEPEQIPIAVAAPTAAPAPEPTAPARWTIR